MGEAPGRILLNGNAESVQRFVELADRCLGPSSHRDEGVRQRDTIAVCTAAWGPTELDDGALRQRLAQRGRGRGGRYVSNLGIHTAVRRFLAERPVVAALYEEHEAVWRELDAGYRAENDGTVARLREAWAGVQQHLPGTGMYDLLTHGVDLPPGPRTRPASIFLRNAYAGRIHRLVADLWEADERHASALQQLWTHFHLAAGIEYDGLWLEQRAALVDTLLGASAVVLAGGSPARLLVGFRFFSLDGVLTEALRRGTSFFGTSAGAMSLGRRVVVFNDKGNPRQEFRLLENGLQLVEGLQIFPHVTDRVQTEDPANLAYLAARFRHRACVGLNQGSVLELIPAGGRWRARSVGDEDVVVLGHTREKRRYPPGTEVAELQ